MFYSRLFGSIKNLDNYVPGGNHGNPLTIHATSKDAQLVLSATNADFKNCLHYPVIDIDVPINLVPASRVGHTHLYINHPVTQDALFEILEVLAKHGIVEGGYVRAAKSQGCSGIRLPWIKKRENIK